MASSALDRGIARASGQVTHAGASWHRVLLVGRGLPDRGGISTFLHVLKEGAPPDGFDIRFLNLTRSGPTQSGRLTGSNIARTLTDVHAVWKASRDADLVHIHTALVPHVTMIRTGLLACAAWLRRRRNIVHVHGG